MRPDFLFHVAAIEADFAPAAGRVEPEGQEHAVERGDQAGLVEVALPVDQFFPQGEEGDSAIHGAGVDIEVVQGLGKSLGEGALAGGTQSVDGDADSGHGVNGQ